MAKTTTKKITKAATDSANKKTNTKTKSKRPPSKYNLFVQTQMKEWKAANPHKPIKEAMAEIGVRWRDSPENPNRGNAPKTKSKKPVASRQKSPEESSE